MTIMGKRIIVLNYRRFLSCVVIAAVLLWVFTYTVSGLAQREEPMSYLSYTVRDGDTLWSIAQEHNPQDLDVREVIYNISKHNDISSDGYIYPSQELIIPVSE